MVVRLGEGDLAGDFADAEDVAAFREAEGDLLVGGVDFVRTDADSGDVVDFKGLAFGVRHVNRLPGNRDGGLGKLLEVNLNLGHGFRHTKCCGHEE